MKGNYSGMRGLGHMFKPILEIMSTYDARNIKYRLDEQETATLLHVPINGKYSFYEILVISNDDENDFTLRIQPLVRVPEDKAEAVLRVVNDINARFRFVKFYLDKSHDVCMQWDSPVSGQNAGEMCFEITARAMSIINTVYPEIMKVIWGTEEG